MSAKRDVAAQLEPQTHNSIKSLIIVAATIRALVHSLFVLTLLYVEALLVDENLADQQTLALFLD